MNDIKAGDFVQIIGQQTVAEVLSVKGNDLEVTASGMKLRIKKNKVQLAEKPEEKQVSLPGSSVAGIDTKEKLMHFKFELDVRGKAKEEVIAALTEWVDDALLLGVEQAKIVHGRGTGVLKDTVRSFLRKYKEVSSAGDDEGRNGDFVTVVKFRI